MKLLQVSAGLFLWIMTIAACQNQNVGAPIPTHTGNQYQNSQRNISFNYPLDWIVVQDSERVVILAPERDSSWEPESPSDIPSDPFVTIQFGEHAEGVLLINNSVNSLTVDSLEGMLRNAFNNSIVRDYSKLDINGFQAYEVTESYEADCERVVYWRPRNLEDLVRISTGCESEYLDEFYSIVESFNQINE